MRKPSRRKVVAGGVGLLGNLLPPNVIAQVAAPAGPLKLAPLGYAFNALQPHIDAETMEIHYSRHHAAYVNNLNAALYDFPRVAAMPLEQMLARIAELPDGLKATVRNNGGGHANHTMFWQVMGTTGAQPSGDIAAAIKRDFGGLDKLRAEFDAAGTRLFGSGWVFVTVTAEGKLAITSRPNQDTPLMDGQRVLFGNDVWEHAYYVTYQNRRADYLKAWWNAIDWVKVSGRYAAAKSGALAI